MKRDNLAKDFSRLKLRLGLVCKKEIDYFNSSRYLPKLAILFVKDSFLFYRSNMGVIIKEVLSGIAVSTLMIPEVIAFSYAAHLEPEDGLFATVIMSLIGSLLSSTGGMVSGAAGALAVVTKDLMDNLGPLGDLSIAQRREYVWVTIMFAGLFQILFGYFRLAKFIKLIPESVMIGFVNGLSILIFITQLTIFEKCDGNFKECTTAHTLYFMGFQSLEFWLTIICLLQTIAIVVFFPFIPKIGKIIPSTLIALVLTTLWEHLFNRLLILQPVRTVGDISSFSGQFPIPSIPFITAPRWSIILSYATMLGFIGICESILTLGTVCSKLGKKMESQMAIQDSFAQGLANLVCGLFNTQGGSAMIAQAMANIMNGATHRLSGIVVGLSVLLFTTALPSLIKLVPIACLSGVLCVIVAKTFYWKSFLLLLRIPIHDSITILLVTILAVVYNLAIAVIVGVIWSCFCFTNSCSTSLTITIQDNTHICEGVLYFGSVQIFLDHFKSVHEEDVVINCLNCQIMDYSAIHAIDSIKKQLHAQGIHVDFEFNELSLDYIDNCIK